MKFPKNKTTLTMVYRLDDNTGIEIPVAVFKTPEAADNYCGACQQDFLDRGITGFTFGTGAVIYYDE